MSSSSENEEDSEAEWEELDASQREGKAAAALVLSTGVILASFPASFSENPVPFLKKGTGYEASVICVPSSCCAGRSPSLSDPAHYQQQLLVSSCSRDCPH